MELEHKTIFQSLQAFYHFYHVADIVDKIRPFVEGLFCEPDLLVASFCINVSSFFSSII